MARELTVRGTESGWLQALRDKVLGVFDGWFPSRDEGENMLPAVRTGRLPDLFRRPFSFGPAVDVLDSDDAVKVVAELPGLTTEDFSVQVDRNRVSLRGEKRSQREERRGDYTFSECSFGSFSRVIPLPYEVVPERAEAEYKDGVLQIVMPKTEAAKARRIKVTVR